MLIWFLVAIASGVVCGKTMVMVRQNDSSASLGFGGFSIVRGWPFDVPKAVVYCGGVGPSICPLNFMI